MAVRTIDDLQPRAQQWSLQRRVVWLFSYVLSFEMAFVLFLNSDSLEIILPVKVNLSIPLLAICMVLAAWIIIRDGIYLRGVYVFSAFLLFLAWILITYSYTPSVILSKDRITIFFLINIWTVAFAALVVANSRERLVRFLVMSLVVGIGVALYGISVAIEYGTVQRFGDQGRAHISWGRTVGPALIVSFALFLFSRILSFRQLVAAGLIGISFSYLLLAGGRGPFLAAAVALVVPFLLGIRLSKDGIMMPRFQLIGLVAALCFAGIVAYLASTGGESAYTISRLLGTFNQQDTAFVEGADRVRYFPAAYQLWIESPLIGHGIGSFSLLYAGYEQAGAYPHNLFLEILAELGLVGLALFLVYAWVCGRTITWQQLRDDPLILVIAMLFILSLMNAMVSLNLAGNRRVFIFLALLAVRPMPRDTTQNQ